jgi:hypothetical protein
LKELLLKNKKFDIDINNALDSNNRCIYTVAIY